MRPLSFGLIPWAGPPRIRKKARDHGKVKLGHVIINNPANGPIPPAQLLELKPKARIIKNVLGGLPEKRPAVLIEAELRLLKSTDRPALKLATSNNP